MSRAGERSRRVRRRPSARQLAVMVAVIGLAIPAAFLALPVEATVQDDPLLRFRVLEGSSAGASAVECGSALGQARASSGGAGLLDLARDDACRSAALRRVLTALAVGAVVVLSGLLAVAASSGRLTRAGAIA